MTDTQCPTEDSFDGQTPYPSKQHRKKETKRSIARLPHGLPSCLQLPSSLDTTDSSIAMSVHSPAVSASTVTGFLHDDATDVLDRLPQSEKSAMPRPELNPTLGESLAACLHSSASEGIQPD